MNSDIISTVEENGNQSIPVEVLEQPDDYLSRFRYSFPMNKREQHNSLIIDRK